MRQAPGLTILLSTKSGTPAADTITSALLNRLVGTLFIKLIALTSISLSRV